jgi:hypothetical protein
MIEEILKKNNLDFEIIKKPLFAKGDNNEEIITPFFGLFNSKTKQITNTVKINYQPTQNIEILTAIIVATKDFENRLTIDKAGSIKDDGILFVQLKTDNESEIGNYKIKQYVVVMDSNNGSCGLSVMVAVQLNENICYLPVPKTPKFRHTSKIGDSIKSISQLIDLGISYNLKVLDLLNEFNSFGLHQLAVDAFVLEILKHNKYSPVYELSKRSITNMDNLYSCFPNNCDNYLSLFYGLIEYVNNYQIAPKRVNSRDEMLIVAEGYKKTLKGFNFCKKFVGN